MQMTRGGAEDHTQPPLPPQSASPPHLLLVYSTYTSMQDARLLSVSVSWEV